MEAWDAIRSRRNVRVCEDRPLAPLAPLARPDRRPFDKVVHRERW